MLTIGDYYYDLFPVSTTFSKILCTVSYILVEIEISVYYIIPCYTFELLESMFSLFIVKMDCILKSVMKLQRRLCLLGKLSSFQGTYTHLSTICFWNHCNSGIQ